MGYDVVVVGAGFAGSVDRRAARDTARAAGAGPRPAAAHRRQRLRRARRGGHPGPSLRPAHLPHQRADDLRVPVARSPLAAVRAPGPRLRPRPARPDPDQPDDDQRACSGCGSARRGGRRGLLRSARRAAATDPHGLRGRRRAAGSGGSCTSCSSAATPGSSGASTRPAGRLGDGARARPGPTTTTATSPIGSRRCRRRLHARCSSGCSTTRGSRSGPASTSPTCDPDELDYAQLVYTGPVDAYFDHRFGRAALPVAAVRVRDARWSGASRRHRQLPRRGVCRTRGSPEFKHLTGQRSDAHDDRPRVPDAPTATRTTRSRGPRTPALYERYEALADGDPGRPLRGPAGDVQVLQHGPGRRPGAHRPSTHRGRRGAGRVSDASGLGFARQARRRPPRASSGSPPSGRARRAVRRTRCPAPRHR